MKKKLLKSSMSSTYQLIKFIQKILQKVFKLSILTELEEMRKKSSV